MTRVEIKGEGGSASEDQLVMATSAMQIRIVRDNLVRMVGLDDTKPGVHLWLLSLLDQTADVLQAQSKCVTTIERRDAPPAPPAAPGP